MKKIIFFDGIDGSGKSTLIEAIRSELTDRYDLECLVLDGNNPPEYKRLNRITQQHKMSPSKVSIFSYRMCRMNLLVNKAVNSPETITLFDRGILHLMVQCKIDAIDPNVLDYFLTDTFNKLSNIKYGHVFFNPSFEVVRARIANRKNADALDLDTAYQANYFRLINDAYNGANLGHKISVDTSQHSISDCVKSILEFIEE